MFDRFEYIRKGTLGKYYKLKTTKRVIKTFL